VVIDKILTHLDRKAAMAQPVVLAQVERLRDL
jgi:hypothetical protein